MKVPIVKPFHFSGELRSGMRTVVLCAVIDGDAPFTFTWRKNGNKIKEGKDLNVRSVDDFTSTLILTNLGPEHNGNYSCRVSNAAGSDEQSNTLNMRGNVIFFIKLYLIGCL